MSEAFEWKEEGNDRVIRGIDWAVSKGDFFSIG